MSFELPPLPYADDALEPYISAQTMSLHHGKHHRAYISKLNRLIHGTEFGSVDLIDIIRAIHDAPGQKALFNNAAQSWNHQFFWNSMKPGGGGAPSDTTLAIHMTEAFGEFDDFRDAFVSAATARFGSGWVWLVADPHGALSIETTPNAETPAIGERIPLVTCDVWEHAYYLDYQNRRADFVGAFIDHLVDWRFAAENLATLGEIGEPRRRAFG
jgi:superoxide dismutase, Fe-Mn family